MPNDVNLPAPSSPHDDPPLTLPGRHAGRAWTFLTLTEAERQHGGNVGYDDAPDRYYSWDSTVANHSRPGANDVCALRDSIGVLGVSRIQHVQATPDVEKIRRRCPVCRSTAFKPRASRTPRFRCSACGAEFEAPNEETIVVTAYRAEYGDGWTAVDGAVTARELDSAYLARAQQHAIREIDLAKLDALLAEKHVLVVTDAPDRLAVEVRPMSGGRRRSNAWQRVGQDPFRRRLLERFGTTCAISGPQPAESLHAAHLYGFAADPRHEVAGGLLLRADLHQLFDAGLIDIGSDLVVAVSPTLRRYRDIWPFHGQSLRLDARDPLLPLTREHLARRQSRRSQEVAADDHPETAATT